MLQRPSAPNSIELNRASLNRLHSINLDLITEGAIEIASEVAQRSLEIINRGELKDEEVQVGNFKRAKTNLDRISDELFSRLIGERFPGMPILSERTRIAGLAGASQLTRDQVIACVDGVDGTAHLRYGDGEWLMNLGFCFDGEADIGISAVPAQKKIFVGCKGRPSIEIALEDGSRRIIERPTARSGITFGICSALDLGGKEELQDRWRRVAEINGATEIREFGSAYSYLMVATGEIDAFVNLGGNFHWDTAAQQVIIEGTGCRLVEIDWNDREIATVTAPRCRYDAICVKDDGHIAAGKGMVIKLYPALRLKWKPVFD